MSFNHRPIRKTELANEVTWKIGEWVQISLHKKFLLDQAIDIWKKHDVSDSYSSRVILFLFQNPDNRELGVYESCFTPEARSSFIYRHAPSVANLVYCKNTNMPYLHERIQERISRYTLTSNEIENSVSNITMLDLRNMKVLSTLGMLLDRHDYHLALDTLQTSSLSHWNFPEMKFGPGQIIEKSGDDESILPLSVVMSKIRFEWPSSQPIPKNDNSANEAIHNENIFEELSDDESEMSLGEVATYLGVSQPPEKYRTSASHSPQSINTNAVSTDPISPKNKTGRAKPAVQVVKQQASCEYEYQEMENEVQKTEAVDEKAMMIVEEHRTGKARESDDELKVEKKRMVYGKDENEKKNMENADAKTTETVDGEENEKPTEPAEKQGNEPTDQLVSITVEQNSDAEKTTETQVEKPKEIEVGSQPLETEQKVGVSCVKDRKETPWVTVTKKGRKKNLSVAQPVDVVTNNPQEPAEDTQVARKPTFAEILSGKMNKTPPKSTLVPIEKLELIAAVGENVKQQSSLLAASESSNAPIQQTTVGTEMEKTKKKRKRMRPLKKKKPAVEKSTFEDPENEKPEVGTQSTVSKTPEAVLETSQTSDVVVQIVNGVKVKNVEIVNSPELMTSPLKLVESRPPLQKQSKLDIGSDGQIDAVAGNPKQETSRADAETEFEALVGKEAVVTKTQKKKNRKMKKSETIDVECRSTLSGISEAVIETFQLSNFVVHNANSVEVKNVELENSPELVTSSQNTNTANVLTKTHFVKLSELPSLPGKHLRTGFPSDDQTNVVVKDADQLTPISDSSDGFDDVPAERESVSKADKKKKKKNKKKSTNAGEHGNENQNLSSESSESASGSSNNVVGLNKLRMCILPYVADWFDFKIAEVNKYNRSFAKNRSQIPVSATHNDIDVRDLMRACKCTHELLDGIKLERELDSSELYRLKTCLCQFAVYMTENQLDVKTRTTLAEKYLERKIESEMEPAEAIENKKMIKGQISSPVVNFLCFMQKNSEFYEDSEKVLISYLL